jgi:hypothetical protein
MAPWTPHFQNHQLPCFWHETIPVRSADHEVVARYHGSRRHFVRLVLWARPMIFGGKGKAEIAGRAGYHPHVLIYVYMYNTSWQIFHVYSRQNICVHILNILTNILFEYDTIT